MIKAILVALLLGSVTTSFAQTMPPLETDEQRFQYLMHVREQVPGLFEDAAKYDIDLFKLLEHQTALVGFLNEHPEYKRMLESHGQAYLRAEIHPQSNSVVKELHIKPEAVSSWREQLIQAYGALPKEQKPPLEILDQQILSALSALTDSGKPRSMGLLTGLIQTLPTADLKAQAFEASSIAEKIKILKSNLPEQLPESFSGTMHGLALRPTQTQALIRLNELLVHEQKLLHLTELHFIAQSHPDHSMVQLEQTISALTENDLVFFVDKDALANKMKLLREKLKAFQKKGFAKELQNQLKGHIEGFSNQTESTSTTLSKGIVLKEMPPGVGIFRGCTGGDCSSQYSFPFPNDPNERLYFVYDEIGGLKGYAQGTIVDVGGKRSFYVITVSGPRMSAGDTKLVIEGLDRSKAALGVEQIVLPVESKLDDLINYPIIKGVFSEYIKGKKTIPIEYKDPLLRRTIQNFESEYNEAQYDWMSTNTNGVALDSNRSAIDIKVTATKFKVAEFHPKPVRIQDVIEFALELDASHREPDLLRTLKIKGISRAEFGEFLSLIKNSLRLSTHDHEAQLKAAFAKYQINENILQRKPALFERGLLNASDAFSPQFEDRTIKMFWNMWKKDTSTSSRESLYAILTVNRERLQNSSTFQQQILEVFTGVEGKDLKTLCALLKADRIRLAPETIRSLILAANDPSKTSLGSVLLSIPANPEVESLFAKEFENASGSVKYLILERVEKTNAYNAEAIQLIAKCLRDPSDPLVDSYLRTAVIAALGKAKVQDPKTIHWIAQYIQPSKEVIPPVEFGVIRPQDFKALGRDQLRYQAFKALGRIQPKDPALQLLLIDEAIHELVVPLPSNSGQRHTDVAEAVAEMFGLKTDEDGWVDVNDIKKVREQVLNKISATVSMPCVASGALEHELAHLMLKR